MSQRFHLTVLLGAMCCCFAGAGEPPSGDLDWPPIKRECRPGAYWWWLGSAVDPTNLTRELQRYRDAGMGAVHIIPIYGAKGWEDRFIPYLSPKWMEMLRHTVTEARRLDLNVDMTTGTGWCFGGPGVTEQEANATAVVKTFDVPAGGALREKLDRQRIQALVAFSPDGRHFDLTSKVRDDGSVEWSPESGAWRVYSVSQKPSGQRVKRAAPGGEGHMLNLIYPEGMKNYLRWFDRAFADYTGPKPRAVYHDSYEYRSDWAPDLFAQFARRRGYRLEAVLPALFGKEATERVARVRCDYRETISDIMVEETLPLWTEWSRRHGMLTRNEAHGSPGNLLDLYALADIPETEMFHKDRNKLVSKLASSAAHVAGRALVACETGTWLREHFTETLADMKYLLDDLFVSGVNHVFYHGTCYSPDEAGWPGWLFYASFEMNPRNSIWHDVPALNAYVARCQAVLQSGRPDNDVLLYWPIHDTWQSTNGTVLPMTVHGRAWFEGQSIGKAAERLWNRGFSFDYVSDRQLALAHAANGKVRTTGGEYRAVLVPRCEHMPAKTLAQLAVLAEAGATVLFEEQVPKDVPGWSDLESYRAEFKQVAARLTASGLKARVQVGEIEQILTQAGVAREPMVEHPGLWFVRRSVEGGRTYFLANRGDQAIDDWIPLAASARSVVVMDPLSGRTGVGALRQGERGTIQALVQLQPGESMILHTFEDRAVNGSAWDFSRPAGQPTELTGKWKVKFILGGPEVPASFETDRLASWADLGDTNAQRFAGTALYTLTFDAPSGPPTEWFLDLGRVCQSARVRLNGRDLGILFTSPYRVRVDSLKLKDNVLEVEVTNVSANRIRDLDRQGVKWRSFHDINFVNIDYKPFDASNWPLADSGLIGPVQLWAATKKAAR